MQQTQMEQTSFHTVKEVFKQVPLAHLKTKMHSNRSLSAESLWLLHGDQIQMQGEDLMCMHAAASYPTF